MQFNHNTSMIPITSLYNMFIVTTLGIPGNWEEICGLKPGQARCSLQNAFARCLAFTPCWAEPCTHSPYGGLANSKDMHTQGETFTPPVDPLNC